MPVKRVNILDTLHLIAGNRSAAHPAPDGYPDTEQFCPEMVLVPVYRPQANKKPAQFTSVRRSYNNALVFAKRCQKTGFSRHQRVKVAI